MSFSRENAGIMRVFMPAYDNSTSKGFDPDSQDVTVHLGEPLYQLSGEVEAPFAHGEMTTSSIRSD